MSSGGTAQDDSLSAKAGPRPRDGPAGQHLRAIVAGPARGAARLTRLCSIVAYGQATEYLRHGTAVAPTAATPRALQKSESKAAGS